jgi:cytoskeleton protein RodZ
MIAVAVSALAVFTAAIVAFVAVGGDGTPTTASTTPSTARRASTTTTVAPTTTPPTTAPLAISDRNGTPTVVVAPPFTLVLTATATSWTQVRDDQGTNLYVGTLTAGDTQSIDAATPVTVTLGNAHGVDIQVNGTPLDTTALPATGDLAFVAS